MAMYSNLMHTLIMYTGTHVIVGLAELVNSHLTYLIRYLEPSMGELTTSFHREFEDNFLTSMM